MYLPETVISEILRKTGFSGYRKILLSSETLRPKATGEMYDDLVAAAGVPASRILHIGDNRYTDGQIAHEKGLRTYCYETMFQRYGNCRNPSYFAVLNSLCEKETAPSILEGMIALDTARNPGRPYWRRFAYQYAGMMTVGYCQWLKEQFDKEGIKKAFFMLRDGYVVEKVFRMLYPDFETDRIFGSRRMFLLARMNRKRPIFCVFPRKKPAHEGWRKL